MAKEPLLPLETPNNKSPSNEDNYMPVQRITPLKAFQDITISPIHEKIQEDVCTSTVVSSVPLKAAFFAGKMVSNEASIGLYQLHKKAEARISLRKALEEESSFHGECTVR